MTGKDYLKQIKKIDTQVRNKSVELKQLTELGLPAGDLLSSINCLHLKKREIIATIEELPEAEYDVLHKVYVQRWSLYEVAADRKVSYSLVTTIHGKALKRLDNMINAKE